MKLARHYDNYDTYIKFQSQKTLNPEKRKKWLGEEWREKVEGFKKEFIKFGPIITENPDIKVLCIGARTGQEVVALNELGVKNAVGIDIVPHEPHVIKGDMHNLDFDDNSFDIIYTNVIDHSIYPEKMIAEMERVVNLEGYIFVQCQVGIDQDEYTEFIIDNPVYDVIKLFQKSFCIISSPMERNFAGMNFEFIFQKSTQLSNLFNKYGSFENIVVPEDYEKLWNDINLPIQNKKLDTNGIISNKARKGILDRLKKRGYYLTRIAECFGSTRIAEVGTAEGWQYYNFCKYVSDECEDGSVSTCDPRDVRNTEYVKIYDSQDKFNYINGTSIDLSKETGSVDMFYIDGLHDEGTVIRDVSNLQSNQKDNGHSVWVFDDFDIRFGCISDIFTLAQHSRRFFIYEIGKTASGQPSHQLLLLAKFQVGE